jgi:hypothetical protein
MAKPTISAPGPDRQEIDESLFMLAEMLLGDHFFDDDKEREYKQKLSKNRPAGSAGVLLSEQTFDLDEGEATLRIEALRTWTHFRVVVVHPEFDATVEGTWSFENETLEPVKVTARNGDLEDMEIGVEMLIQELEGPVDDEEFAEFMEGLDDDDDEEVPLIGDDPTEPPEATGLDRSRVKAIAKRIARDRDSEINVEDRGWLEQTPQVLPVITEQLVGTVGAATPNEALVLAYHLMLALQLEFVRYRQDRGWEWADDMLEAYQQRLVALGNDGTIPQDDWFMMCGALTEARVPVSDSVAVALAEAGFKPDADGGPPEQMMRTLRGFMDELAGMMTSPFDVIQALQNAGAILPSALRGFMATELALSPHPVLRDAVPVMLLDEDSTVRKDAAGALEQTARADTLSPDALRRAIALRNWIPAGDRPALDAAIRKARLAGVEIGAWPVPWPDLEFYASIVDGSGAQSIFAVSRLGKKGLFAGVLLRFGAGVIDTWIDPDLSRGKINKMLREAQMSAACTRVDKAFVDTMVQHAIGTSVAQDAVPPALLLELAEILGGTEWKDRRLDVAAEAERLFEALDPGERSPEAVEAGLESGLDRVAKDEMFATWFEDGPQVQKALAKLPRTDQVGMIAVVMNDILPDKRAEWAERFLVMAMWCQAATEAKHRAKARDLVLVANALVGDEPIGAIPAMAGIALNTTRAMLLGGW